LGVIPGWNGTERLLQTVGKGNALRLLISGLRVEAKEAIQIGLIDVLCEKEPVLQAALAFTSQLDLCAPLSIKTVKKMVATTLYEPRAASREFVRSEFARLWFTKDHKEAEQAFSEKRKPRFVGE
jgi:enoyl-CoA hydratase